MGRLIFNRMWGLAAAVLLAIFCSPGFAATESASANADTRVLIDVSGSMKQNDPRNLRRPALRLLVGLLPTDTRAGVWTFGQYVNSQVPLGQVNSSWKKRARAGAGKIHSRGLFTNIEEVLKRSTADWKEGDASYRRHVVLLTDGMVDVSKNPDDSAASRERIIKQLLPRLKKLGVKVHTIALSERADHELMKKLAVTTGGWYEQVNDADQLKRVFLRIFEKVGRPDAVPLKGNRFKVDKSIQEATLLVFRDPLAKQPTRVITPSGKKFGISNAPSSITWHQDEGYDLLTIKKPEPGEWQIQAKIDPDNRVMVVTDLKMLTAEVPSLVAIGEKVPLQVRFTNQGKLITQEKFLNVVHVKAEYFIGEDLSEPQPLYDDGEEGDEKFGDGLFGARLLIQAEGESELILTAEGKTFVREQHQMFRIRHPAQLVVTKQTKDGKEGVAVQVIPDGDLVQLVGVTTQAWMKSPGGTREGLILLPEGVGAWGGWIDTTQFDGARTLNVEFSGESHAENPINLFLDPVTIRGTPPKAPPPKPAAEEAADEKAAEAASKEEGILGNNLVVFGIVNLVVLLLAGVGYYFWRRAKQKRLVKLVEDELEEEEGEEAEAGSAKEANDD